VVRSRTVSMRPEEHVMARALLRQRWETRHAAASAGGKEAGREQIAEEVRKSAAMACPARCAQHHGRPCCGRNGKNERGGSAQRGKR